MALYGDGYEQYNAPTSGAQQQQHTQQHTQQPISADGLGSDPYSNELFADPRYHVPPSFLDEPPRGPEAITLFSARDPQYFPHQHAMQDPAWGNYLRLPTGQTPPPGYPIARTVENTQYYPTDPSSQSYAPIQYSLSYLDGSEPSIVPSIPASDELAAFPSMSLESQTENSSNIETAPTLDVHNGNKEASSLMTGVQPAPPSSLLPQPLATQQATQASSRSQGAVIATPGQPTPFGPLFYSSSGFDMIGVLTRVANRKNPQVVLGPVDFTCSFIVSDAQAPDEPIVYASPTFVSMTRTPPPHRYRVLRSGFFCLPCRPN